MGIVIDPQLRHSFEYDGAKFEVVCLTGREVLRLSTQLSEVNENADAIYSILHSCVKGWTGINDSNGKPVVCNPASIDSLPVEVAVKVFEFIAQLSGLSGDDQGN